MYLAKKPDKADPNEARLSRFTCCALSGEPLAAPAVADRLGNLFNKEPLVEALLHKRLPKALSHIRGLKDMIPIHLQRRVLSHLRSIRHRRCSATNAPSSTSAASATGASSATGAQSAGHHVCLHFFLLE
jgi:hypothetical protein